MLRKNKKYSDGSIGGFTANFSYIIIPLYIIILNFFIILLYADLDTKNQKSNNKIRIINEEFNKIHYDNFNHRFSLDGQNEIIFENAFINEINHLIDRNFILSTSNHRVDKDRLLFLIPENQVFGLNHHIKESMKIFINEISTMLNSDSSLKLEIIFYNKKNNDLNFDKILKIENIANLLYERLKSDKSFQISVDNRITEDKLYIIIKKHK